MSKTSKKKALSEIEVREIKKLATVARNLDSPDPQIMYSSGHSLVELGTMRSLLPKAMALLTAEDVFVRKLVFRTAGLNAFGPYIGELFKRMSDINPAEREQVLHAIEERFSGVGGPLTAQEQKRWIAAMESLGREHQPTVVGIMAHLGSPGEKWVSKLIKQNVESVSPGLIPRLSSFPEKKQRNLLKLLCLEASERNRDLLQFIGEAVGKTTVRYLAPFLKSGSWQDRAIVSGALGRVGLTTSDGFIMDVIADPDWRVKQEFLENLDLKTSKFSSVFRIMGFFIKDSHTRVSGLAERVLLLLGCIECINSNLESQRKKIEKKYRPELLRAAARHKDVDCEWLGISPGEIDPVPYIDDLTEAGGPEGVSLSDIGAPSDSAPEEPASAGGGLDLMAALLGAKKDAETTIDGDESMISAITKPSREFDPSMSDTEKFIWLLKDIADKTGKEVPVDELQKRAKSKGFSKKKFDGILYELEKEGTVYRSSRGTISHVDIDL